MSKRVITIEDIVEAGETGLKTILCPKNNCIVTPSARDRAEALGITLVEDDGPPVDHQAPGGAQEDQAESLVRQVCQAMQNRLPSTFAQTDLEKVVREVVQARLADIGAPPAKDPREEICSGLCLIHGRRLLGESSSPMPVEGKALLADAINCGDGVKLSAGIMMWEKTSFIRTVDYPEIAVVIEGELHLTVDGKTIIGRPGDMLYLPKGLRVDYSTPSSVKLACVNSLP